MYFLHKMLQVNDLNDLRPAGREIHVFHELVETRHVSMAAWRCLVYTSYEQRRASKPGLWRI